MSYNNFNTFKSFKNVGINSSSNYALSMKSTGNNISFHSSNSIDYNNVDIMSIKNIINKKQNEDLNLSSLNGNTINPVITINNNNQDCKIMTNLNVNGNLNVNENLNVLNGEINIKKLAINGDYGSNTKYLKSGGSDSDLTWDTIASSPWATSGNDIYYNSGNVGIGTINPTEKLDIEGNIKINNSILIKGAFAHHPIEVTLTSGWLTNLAEGGLQIDVVSSAFTNGFIYSNTAGLYLDGHRVNAAGFDTASDDRLKINEELIINTTNTLLKLRPQIYDKKKNLSSSETKKEAGLIVQEIYYEAPELRYLINIPDDATLIDDNKYRNFDDIRNDPDYSNWGTSPASLNYNGLIPYLIQGFKEQQNKINTLKTENQQQQTKINTLETENAELKSIIDKLKTANSFEEFKNSL